MMTSKRKFWRILILVTAILALSPAHCPAPLIWRKGEGWTYESGAMPVANTPADQLKIAEQFHAQKDYRAAINAYRRLVRRWPTSAAAPKARFGLAECLSAIGYHYQAFRTYKELLQKHPDTDRFTDVLQRQFEIGKRFLAGERDKLWGIRWFPAHEKAIEIFEYIVKTAPYSPIAPQAQFHLGLTHERLRDYLAAVRAYEQLLERYPEHELAEAAQYAIGAAYMKEAKRAEYDQNAADQAILAFTDYLVAYPKGAHAEQARQHLAAMKLEQARGLYQVGLFYEKQRNYKAALIYYNEVIEKNPQSTWAQQAKNKIARLSAATDQQTATR